MEFLDIIRVVIVLTALHIKTKHGLEMHSGMVKKAADICQKISKEPYFENELVVGRPWRIYYTWNLRIENKCMEMVFKNATPMIIDRFWVDMNEYLEQQPYWAAATLHMSMGSEVREMLLLSNQGVAGSFDAVPDVIQHGSMAPERGSVPLLKFQMKLLSNNRYLLVSDCHIGIMSLATRVGRPPYKMEVAALAESLNFGDGFPSCVEDKRKDEEYYLN